MEVAVRAEAIEEEIQMIKLQEDSKAVPASYMNLPPPVDMVEVQMVKEVDLHLNHKNNCKYIQIVADWKHCNPRTLRYIDAFE